MSENNQMLGGLEGLGEEREGIGNDPNPLSCLIPTSSCGYGLQCLGALQKIH